MTRQWIALSTHYPADPETLSLSPNHRYAWVVLLTVQKRNGWGGSVNVPATQPFLASYAGLTSRQQGYFFRAVHEVGWITGESPNYLIPQWDTWQKDPGAGARAKRSRDARKPNGKRDRSGGEIALTGTGTRQPSVSPSHEHRGAPRLEQDREMAASLHALAEDEPRGSRMRTTWEALADGVLDGRPQSRERAEEVLRVNGWSPSAPNEQEEER